MEIMTTAIMEKAAALVVVRKTTTRTMARTKAAVGEGDDGNGEDSPSPDE
jgi:hypothetical protein